MTQKFVTNRVAPAVLAMGIGLLAATPPAAQPASAQQAGAQALASRSYPAPKLDFAEDQILLALALADRPAIASYYGRHGLKPVFTGPDGAARRAALIEAMGAAGVHGLPTGRYPVARLRSLPPAGTAAMRAAAEAEFAFAFALWVHDLSAGMLEPGQIDAGIKRKPAGVNLAKVLDDFVTSPDPAGVLADLAPKDPRYLALQAELARMGAMLAPAGVPDVPPGLWRPGARGPEVLRLRARLAALGFAAAGTDPELYDEDLAEAVRQYQTRVGLQADGVAGPTTIDRLNQGPGAQMRAIVVAMERLRWMHGIDLNQRHVWVNLPEFNVRIMEDGRETFVSRTVIGKDTPDRRSPEFSDMMEYLVVNPSWNVPRSITTKEYLPKLRQNRYALSYLEVVDGRGRVVPRGNIDFGSYSDKNFPFRLRQKPSGDNALGIVKFIFPNDWNIYLHDTPSKSLFSNSSRAYSHGCIRVADPRDLAAALLSKQTDDPAGLFQRAVDSGKETWIHLEPELPVHLVYFTAYPDSTGKIRYYPDIYGRDTRLYAAIADAGLELGGASD